MESNSSVASWRTPALTVIAPVAWGSTYYVTDAFLPSDRPLFAALLRALPVGLLLLALRPALPSGAWWWKSVVLGTLNIGAFFVLIFIAAYRLPSGMAATLTATAPIAMMAVAWLLIGERPRLASISAAVLGVSGVALLVLRAGFAVDPIGVAASLGAVVMSSFGYVLLKRWQAPVDLLTLTAWQLVAGGLLLLPVALLVEGAPPAIDAGAGFGFLYIGLIGTGLANYVWFRGLQRMPAASVSLIGLLNPVTGTILGVFLAHEVFGPTQLLGMALVLLGVLLGQTGVRRAARPLLLTILQPVLRRVGTTTTACSDRNNCRLAAQQLPVRGEWVGHESNAAEPAHPGPVRAP
ncbi:putative blue pigment (indigoidine) exporter [Nocardioides daedukensis]|uniref:Putative blue pigment (Indigoidine) exporter n=1 Tax=Nocardioides daedukensis TaxID=634462 RepID=A0A7Y9S304_9ACTN|nr:EamA family transporter [Nocardioides daedukensis]NYG59133.1 putative blue pigment (indigoidine) exporter [Nocardioides daedukensis]